MRNRRSLGVLLVAAIAAVLPVVPAAAQTAPAPRPCGQGAPCPRIKLQGPLPQQLTDDPQSVPSWPDGGADTPAGYERSEWFVTGTTALWNYDRHPAVRGAKPGDALTQVRSTVAYTTRVVVIRPSSPARFNGVVVLEQLNSSSGFDVAPLWGTDREYFAREGIAWIGVTTSANQSLQFLKGGCGSVLGPCADRYAGLQIQDNGQEYEIVSQLVTGLKGGEAGQAPLPDGYGRVRRVLVAGESQQAGSVMTHANEFSFPLVDGYVIQSAGRSRAVKGGTLCSAAGAPAYPECTATLGNPADQLPRNDLPMPVLQVMAEHDVLGLSAGLVPGATRVEDSSTFRLVEVAGTPHSTTHRVELLGRPLSALCAPDTTSFHDGPVRGAFVQNAMIDHLLEQVERGTQPPRAPRLDIAGGAFVRDRHGNVTGGIRLPELTVPVARYDTGNAAGPGLDPALTSIGNLACRLSGKATPFSDDQLAALYPTFDAYAVAVRDATDALVRQGWLLPEDAAVIKADHAISDVGRTAYWVARADGTVDPQGSAPDLGSSNRTGRAPVVGIAATPTGKGYWLAAADGEVVAFGDAVPLRADRRAGSGVVGIAATPSGRGAWLATADGGVVALGDAAHHGSMAGRRLNAAISGIAASATGGGYWLVAQDGGVFAFGDAPFRGSLGATRVVMPIFGIAPTATGGGYWLVGADGGVFSFGDAIYHGRVWNPDGPVVGIARSSDPLRYRVVTANGEVHSRRSPTERRTPAAGGGHVVGIATALP